MAKLSEILAQSIKLKGGGILNLKGFSKRVIDKEIGGGGGGESGAIDKIIKQYFNPQMIPHSSKFYNETTDNIIDILDFEQGDKYHFLYKKSDYIELSPGECISIYVEITDNLMNLGFALTDDTATIMYETVIDGETYVAIGDNQ